MKKGILKILFKHFECDLPSCYKKSNSVIKILFWMFDLIFITFYIGTFVQHMCGDE